MTALKSKLGTSLPTTTGKYQRFAFAGSEAKGADKVRHAGDAMTEIAIDTILRTPIFILDAR